LNKIVVNNCELAFGLNPSSGNEKVGNTNNENRSEIPTLIKKPI